MVVDEPVTEALLAEVLDDAPEDVAERLRALADEYAEPGAASSCAGSPAAGASTPGASTPPTWSGSCSTASRSG